MQYTPRVYQHPIRQFIFDHERCNIFAGMGVGKSASTLDAILSLLMFGEVRRVLILGPKRVAMSTWPAEIRQWDQFKHLSIAVAVGSESQRIAALRSGATITTCTYDLLPWLVEVLGDAWPFDMVVCDEVTKTKSLRVAILKSKTGKSFFRGQGGVRAKALSKVAFTKVKRWVGLTGTPAPNGLEDLWALIFWLDLGRRLGTSYDAFIDRFFTRVMDGQGYAKVVPMKSTQKFIEDAIRDVCLTIEAKDFFDLPPLIENHIKVELPPKARKHYDEIEKQLFTEIEEHNVQVFNAASVSNKALQIASGAAYVDDQGTWVEVHDAKIEALQSVVEEAMGMPVLVAYQFKSDLARILKAFPKARQLTADPQVIEEWNKGLIPMLVAHPASAGHGLSLQHGSNIMVYFSNGWALEADLQFAERIGPTRQAQSGYKRPVYMHRIIAADTVEEVVVRRIKSKASVQDALMQALKDRRQGCSLA